MRAPRAARRRRPPRRPRGGARNHVDPSRSSPCRGDPGTAPLIPGRRAKRTGRERRPVPGLAAAEPVYNVDRVSVIAPPPQPRQNLLVPGEPSWPLDPDKPVIELIDV